MGAGKRERLAAQGRALRGTRDFLWSFATTRLSSICTDSGTLGATPPGGEARGENWRTLQLRGCGRAPEAEAQQAGARRGWGRKQAVRAGRAPAREAEEVAWPERSCAELCRSPSCALSWREESGRAGRAERSAAVREESQPVVLSKREDA